MYVSFTATKGLDNMGAIRTLVQGGVWVGTAVFDNEPFYPAGGYNFNSALYLADFTKWFDSVRVEFPNIRIGLPLAPRPKSSGVKGGSVSHDTWNNAMFGFINSHPSVEMAAIIHIYFTGNEVQAMGNNNTDEVAAATTDRGTFPAKRNYNFNMQDTWLETYFKNCFEQAEVGEIDSLWSPIISYIRNNINSPIFVDEYGFVNSDNFHGTFTDAMKIFQILLKYGEDSRIMGLGIHAGESKGSAGIVSPRKTYDVRDIGGNNVSCPTLDALTMYGNMNGIILPYNAQSLVAGHYSLWFVNTGGSFTPTINVGAGHRITTQTIYSLSGSRYSSTVRNTIWTDKGSVFSPNEVTGIKITDDVIEPLSFGYIDVYIEDMPTQNTAPIAEAGANQSVTTGATITAHGTYTDADNNVLVQEWYLDGARIATGYDLIYTFETSGTYIFTFKVVDAYGLEDSDTFTATVTTESCYKKSFWYFLTKRCKVSTTKCNCE